MHHEIRIAVLAALLAAVNAAGCRDSADAGWFPFHPANALEDGVAGMSAWLDKPAGKHGVLRMDGGRLVFEDGTPARLWGTNHGGRGAAPDAAEADARASWYARYGINAIRLHKFTYPSEAGIGDPEDSTRILPDLVARMDYYCARLREHGIYYTWSHIFGFQVTPSQRGRLLGYDELVREDPARGGLRRKSTHGLVNLFPDLQDLHIELTVNMLAHVNPHTGLRYADDPALAMIELQNEDNAWWTAGESLAVMPVYKAELCRRFSAWLRGRYGSHEALVAAWGPAGIDLWPELQTGEHLDKDNVYPVPDRRYYQPDDFATSPAPQRLADCARFLHEAQMAFYERFAAAIRATGYRGLLIASCWKADAGVPHYYNLLADAEIGLIDRHNYYGPSPHRLAAGMQVKPAGSMLRERNMGLLGVGLNQVAGRPFSFSEWISKIPNEWVAEGSPVVAFYGMGLQGWDASFHFASSGYGFEDGSDTLAYVTNHPLQLALFPALARSVYRGDVAEGRPLPRRRLTIDDLRAGRLPFSESSVTEGDVNTLDGVVPAEALALGRVELALWPVAADDEIPFPESWNSPDGIVSTTGQLKWVRDDGYFTVDTAATKAVVGHARDIPLALGDVTVRLRSPFGVVLLTSLDPAKPLAETDAALLTVVGRARNTGMRYSADGSVLEEVGGPPILMEGVALDLRWERLMGARLDVLDHDGFAPVSGRALDGPCAAIDTGADRAVYYRISWKP